MLFLTVVKDFVSLAQIESKSNMQIVHSFRPRTVSTTITDLVAGAMYYIAAASVYTDGSNEFKLGFQSLASGLVVNPITKQYLSWKVPSKLLYEITCIFNNYWMRLNGISRIIEAEVGLICRSRRLRQITLNEFSIILDISRKHNSRIILLFT